MSSKFQEQMLDATFAYARLALSHAVLLNGAAATALLAFLGAAHPQGRAALTTAVIWFGAGAVLGGFASLAAYLGQRLNWEAVKENPEESSASANVIISIAVLFGISAFVMFLIGAVLASCGLRS